MVIRPVVIAVICVGLFIIIESLMLPKAMAFKTNGFRMQDQRTHKRRNYMLQRARDKEILKSLQERGASYDTEIEALDPASTIPERLAYIVDYANTIDDEYFVDKSVETRTKKRADDKKTKQNQAIPDLPCTCDYVISLEKVGDNAFPRKLHKMGCRKPPSSSCAPGYYCQEIHYNVPTLQLKTSKNDPSSNYEDLLDIVPNNLSARWYTINKSLAVGCQCLKTTEYDIETNTQK